MNEEINREMYNQHKQIFSQPRFSFTNEMDLESTGYKCSVQCKDSENVVLCDSKCKLDSFNKCYTELYSNQLIYISLYHTYLEITKNISC